VTESTLWYQILRGLVCSFSFAEGTIPGTNHVLRRERFAIVPVDPVAQFEDQLGSILAELPARREIGHDRLSAGWETPRQAGTKLAIAAA
jgi:hypothetical protein